MFCFVVLSRPPLPLSSIGWGMGGYIWEWTQWRARPRWSKLSRGLVMASDNHPRLSRIERWAKTGGIVIFRSEYLTIPTVQITSGELIFTNQYAASLGRSSSSSICLYVLCIYIRVLLDLIRCYNVYLFSFSPRPSPCTSVSSAFSFSPCPLTWTRWCMASDNHPRLSRIERWAKTGGIVIFRSEYLTILSLFSVMPLPIQGKDKWCASHTTQLSGNYLATPGVKVSPTSNTNWADQPGKN